MCPNNEFDTGPFASIDQEKVLVGNRVGNLPKKRKVGMGLKVFRG